MNLKRSVDNLAKRLERFDPVVGSSNKTSLTIWKDKPIIPLEKWIEIKNTAHALDYFPDDFDQVLTCISEDQMGVELEDVKKWESDYLELMEYVKNPTYGRLKCFHCLLSPAGDDPIFIGINRLIAKGLTDSKIEKNSIPYPCQVVNRFECPYENTNVTDDDYDTGTAYSNFNVEHLFRLHKMAFIVEIALAKARKEDSEIRIKDKQELLHALTDRDAFFKILQQANDTLKSTEYLREISAGQDVDYFVDYFMRIRDKIALEELRFY